MAHQDRELRRRVLLTVQVALLGMVTPSLRGVTVHWDDRRILAHCFFDGPIGEEERETCSDIEAEVMASFPNHKVDVLVRRLDAMRTSRRSYSLRGSIGERSSRKGDRAMGRVAISRSRRRTATSPVVLA